MLTKEETKAQKQKISSVTIPENLKQTFGMEAVFRSSSVLLNFKPEKSSYIRQPIEENEEFKFLRRGQESSKKKSYT